MTARKAERLKLLAGTDRADRLPKANGAGRLMQPPQPPGYLSTMAARQWRLLARQFVASGILAATDLVALAMLCEALADEKTARTTLLAEGLTIEGGSGGRKQHPAIRQAEAARALACRLLIEFGATPRGRQGIDQAPAPAAAAGGPWERLRALQGGER